MTEVCTDEGGGRGGILLDAENNSVEPVNVILAADCSRNLILRCGHCCSSSSTVHRLSCPIRAISDLTGPGVCHHRRSAYERRSCTWIMGTAQCGRRISTFSLPSLDCLLRCSLGDDYRSLRSRPSSLFSGLVRGLIIRYSTQASSFLCSCISDNHDIPASARFRPFAPCFSLRTVLLEYDRIRHLINHRPFRVHRQDRADSLKSVLRSIGAAVHVVCSLNVREIMRNMESIIPPLHQKLSLFDIVD